MRAAAQQLRELIRKNTLDPKHNMCEFDKTQEDKKREQVKMQEEKRKAKSSYKQHA